MILSGVPPGTGNHPRRIQHLPRQGTASQAVSRCRRCRRAPAVAVQTDPRSGAGCIFAAPFRKGIFQPHSCWNSFRRKGSGLRDHMRQQRQLCCEKRQHYFCLRQGAEPGGGSSILGQSFPGKPKGDPWLRLCAPEEKGQVKGRVGGCPCGPRAVWTRESQTPGFPAASVLSAAWFPDLRFWAAKYRTDLPLRLRAWFGDHCKRIV